MRLAGRVLSYLLYLVLATAVGCGGSKSDSSSDQTAARINITPSSLDLTEGSVSSISASVVNASGTALTTQPKITYSTTDSSAVTVSSSGSICAGVWDVNYVVCRTGTIPSSAVTITASADNVSASIPVTVHLKLDHIVLSAPRVSCVSQNDSLQFTAKAFNNGVDVTSALGSFNWTLQDGTIGQISSTGLAVARIPGISNVVASASNVTSAPLALVVCPPASIQLSEKSTGNTSFSFSKGDSTTLETTIVDTQGNPINGLSLTLSTSEPTVARVSASDVVNASVTTLSAGAFTILASCTPKLCNSAPIGVITTPSGETTAQALGFGYPIYSNLVKGTVAGTTTTSIYVTGDRYPDGHTNHQLRVYDSVTLTQETSITLPYVPNSMIFTRQGTKAFIGSSDGTDGNAIMTFDPSSNSVTVFSGVISGDSSISRVTGKILAIAPDGSKVIVSNPAIDRVFVVDVSASTAQVVIASGIHSAAFSPDSFRAFLAGESGVYEYVTSVHKVTSLNTTASSAIAYLPQGPAAYISGSQLTAYSTCSSQVIDQQTIPLGPLVSLFSSADPALVGVNGTSWTAFSVNAGRSSCPNAISSAVGGVATAPCQVTQLVPASNGSKVFATAFDQSCGLLNEISQYDVSAAASTGIVLSNGGTPVAGDVTLDSTQLYEGVLNGDTASVHYIDVSSSTDRLAIDVPFVPDIVAVLPK